MPKPRGQNIRKINKKLFILCEGEKTEPNYFQSLIDTLSYPEKLLEVKIVKTVKNTCKELVAEGKKLKEIPGDEIWIVVDKDGYTHHPQAFNMAQANNVKIAFSSISFEIWVLCHFENTTRQFQKSENVIKYINRKNYIPGGYQKNDKDIYGKIKDRMIKFAFKNAKFLRDHHFDVNNGDPIYNLNPYTDIDILVERLYELVKECKEKQFL